LHAVWILALVLEDLLAKLVYDLKGQEYGPEVAREGDESHVEQHHVQGFRMPLSFRGLIT
jgi:hypothetical protein